MQNQFIKYLREKNTTNTSLVDEIANALEKVDAESLEKEISDFKEFDGSDINDDGISHKKEGGLKLQVKYETLQNGTSKVYAKLV